MDKDRLAQNLAAVEKHFHSEGMNEAALETFTDALPSLGARDAPSPGRETDRTEVGRFWSVRVGA